MSQIFCVPPEIQIQMLTSNQWYIQYANNEIVNCDGWSKEWGTSWETDQGERTLQPLTNPKDYWFNVPISYDEFYIRYCHSTLRIKPSAKKTNPFD